MKWERYNQLTQEQKEEYNYKFKNGNISIDSGNLLLTGAVLMLIVTSLYTHHPALITKNVFMELMQFIKIYFKLSIGVYILVILVRIWKTYQQRKWLRENLPSKAKH